MNPQIFREYDIRGIAGEDLTLAEVEELGRGLGTWYRRHDCRRISVGRDCRLSSPEFSHSVIQGLRATGCDVIDIGIGPTPLLYFSIHHLSADGGVMVTASHNPSEYNGFKVCRGLDSVHGHQIQAIARIIAEKNFETGTGRLETAAVSEAYLDFLVRDIRLSRPLRVGVDAGNGTAGMLFLPILERLGCDVQALYCDMDGRFPNHPADPTVLSNLQDLIALVKTHQLDVGFGFDGDGDRLGVVDEQGNVIYGDRLMIIFAREILSRHGHGTFIGEVKCSQVMYDEIEARGGRAIMWKTGHSLIKEKMKAEQALLAGEMSGHIFFAERYLGYDDALYAACRLLEILDRQPAGLSQLLTDLPHTFVTPEIRVDCPDNLKFEVAKRLAQLFRASYPVIEIDGVRILFEDGWGLLRASNTQPALVMRFEARTEARLDAMRALVEDALREAL